VEWLGVGTAVELVASKVISPGREIRPVRVALENCHTTARTPSAETTKTAGHSQPSRRLRLDFTV
jgi:hypothetical protein